MGSLFKKIKSISKGGIEPILQGQINYKSNIDFIEQKAITRSKQCVRCTEFVDEPIDMFKVNDERLPYLSDKMCDQCGCALPYLLRQDIKICKLWK